MGKTRGGFTRAGGADLRSAPLLNAAPRSPFSSIASDSLRIGSVHPVRAGVDGPPPDGRKEVDSELFGEALGCQLAANPVAGCVQGRRVVAKPPLPGETVAMPPERLPVPAW